MRRVGGEEAEVSSTFFFVSLVLHDLKKRGKSKSREDHSLAGASFVKETKVRSGKGRRPGFRGG